ncbi:MAG: ribonuclease III [Thermodesulfobacteriota bacterium]
MTRIEAKKRLMKRISFSFKDADLFESVFVHSSFVNEKGSGESNERLEFLGDAVLSAVVSDILYSAYPELQEGELTSMRSRLVNRAVLSGLASELGMGELIRLGKGEKKSRGSENPAILADAFEALIAAAYLDNGFPAAEALIKKLFLPLLKDAFQGEKYFDYKPKLQELTQRRFKKAPLYRLVSEEGPSHKKKFCVEALVNGEVMGKGSGARKKDAEQASAKEALEELLKRGIE